MMSTLLADKIRSETSRDLRAWAAAPGGGSRLGMRVPELPWAWSFDGCWTAPTIIITCRFDRPRLPLRDEFMPDRFDTVDFDSTSKTT